MNKELITQRLELLLKLVEETQPDIPTSNYLFQPHHYQVQNWIELLENDALVSSISDVMLQANSMWKFRNKFKNGEYEDIEMFEMDAEIDELLSKGHKITAIKLYRNQMLEMGKKISLREAKTYVDAIELVNRRK